VSLWIKHHRLKADLASQSIRHNVLDGLYISHLIQDRSRRIACALTDNISWLSATSSSYILQAWMERCRDLNDRDQILALACKMKYVQAKV
jgi:hypothetical protein